jgi:hypothetical protein
MDYPFANTLAKPNAAGVFKKKLPHIEAALPEFFRVLAIANQSIAQRNMFGMPQGIRQDLGVDTALKLLLVACFQDRLINAQHTPTAVADVLRKLVLQWYALGNALQSCLFFGYYFYTLQSQALYVIQDLLQQIGVLVDPDQAVTQDADVLNLLAPTHSNRWYTSSRGVGDKLFAIIIPTQDATRTDLPRPGYLIHFKKTGAFDLRAPLFVPLTDVEEPTLQNNKIIARCPRCSQKCRGTVFDHIEITCPACQQHWKQWT